MQHFSHKHLLILNENYDARDGDVCYGCNEEIVSCKSFVYSCIRSSDTNSSAVDDDDEECVKFLLHKTCAELPKKIKSPLNQERFLYLYTRPSDKSISIADPGPFICNCIICGKRGVWFAYSDGGTFSVCLRCAMFQLQSMEHRKFHHPAHPQHRLTLVQRLSSFKCDVCEVENNSKDLSYICNKCPFWMHKTCADAPTSFLFQFHEKHPLILSFSLPKLYQKFDQYCRLCNKRLDRLICLYYCPNCRFFVHFQCARSSRILRSSENEIYSDLVHLPAANESSVILLVEQFVMSMSTPNHNHNGTCSATNPIKHWAHEEHHLQLTTINELNSQTDDNEMSLVCDGCVKPLRTDGGLFYSCVPCKFFLHKFCAEFPRKIEHPLWPGNTLLADKHSEPYDLFFCASCNSFCNGISFHHRIKRFRKLHIGCVTLPKIIKHETHSHPLNQMSGYNYICRGCRERDNLFMHRCEECDFCLCAQCIMKAKTVQHPWDPHSLHLIYEPGMVTDHEHDFNCEFCYEDIDTNMWFYHCSHCDLSFHLDDCFERSCYRHYSNVKFGASNINIRELHPHSLRFVLNKKFRSCKECGSHQLAEPVLECAPCKVIFCTSCCSKIHS